MSLTCCDCQSPIQRRHTNGRPPKRCAPCKKKKARRQAKAWAEANPEKVRYKRKPPRHAQCVDCERPIDCSGKRGPLAKRCVACHALHAKKSQRSAARKKLHGHVCKQCGTHFFSSRKHQPYCSPDCVHLAQRKRITLVCQNESCGKPFEVTPSEVAAGNVCCSWQCRAQHMLLPDCFCQNPACGKKIEREAPGPRKTARGQDSRKYCCRECAWDHRWGSDRPRKDWSKKHLASASAGALRTSLRKKCKLLGVPFDEQCTRRAVLERDGWVCQLCKIECNREYVIEPKTRKPDPRNAEHDHIVPLTADGSPGNVFPNSQCLCRKCNNNKRARSIGQLRLDLEGSVKRWESGGLVRRQRNSRSCVATQAIGQSTKASRSRSLMAL